MTCTSVKSYLKTCLNQTITRGEFMQGVANDPSTDKRHNHLRIDKDITPLPGEVWKDVKEWKGYQLQDGYQVSNLGRVRSLGRILVQRGNNGKLIEHPYPPCMMRLTADPDGYLFVGLRTTDSKHRTQGARVHQLVAVHFLDTQPRPDQTQVNHIDGNKENNTPENLEWASPDENNRHARETGLARLGTSQAICGRIVEYNEVCESKVKLDRRLGRYAGYVDYCHSHDLPIIDKNTGQQVHVEWIGLRKE